MDHRYKCKTESHIIFGRKERRSLLPRVQQRVLRHDTKSIIDKRKNDLEFIKIKSFALLKPLMRE